MKSPPLKDSEGTSGQGEILKLSKHTGQFAHPQTSPKSASPFSILASILMAAPQSVDLATTTAVLSVYPGPALSWRLLRTPPEGGRERVTAVKVSTFSHPPACGSSGCAGKTFGQRQSHLPGCGLLHAGHRAILGLQGLCKDWMDGWMDGGNEGWEARKEGEGN